MNRHEKPTIQDHTRLSSKGYSTQSSLCRGRLKGIMQPYLSPLPSLRAPRSLRNCLLAQIPNPDHDQARLFQIPLLKHHLPEIEHQILDVIRMRSLRLILRVLEPFPYDPAEVADLADAMGCGPEYRLRGPHG